MSSSAFISALHDKKFSDLPFLPNAFELLQMLIIPIFELIINTFLKIAF